MELTATLEASSPRRRNDSTEAVELRKNGEGSSLLLLRDSVLRAASTTSPTRGCGCEGALPSLQSYWQEAWSVCHRERKRGSLISPRKRGKKDGKKP